MTSYLTSGQTSRGRIGLTAELNLTILESPYLVTAEDTAAVVQSFSDILAGVQAVPGLELLFPDLKSTTIEEHVRGGTDRGANHWLGTAAVGKVVDVDAKVFGMQNLVSRPSPCPADGG
jgi:cellobiose dehydrogenase (acceptor)